MSGACFQPAERWRDVNLLLVPTIMVVSIPDRRPVQSCDAAEHKQAENCRVEAGGELLRVRLGNLIRHVEMKRVGADRRNREGCQDSKVHRSYRYPSPSRAPKRNTNPERPVGPVE